MITIEQAWWLLFTLNVCLTIYLIYRHSTVKRQYERLENELYEDYKRVEGHCLDEGDKYFEARKEYEQKLKELSND